VGNFNGRFNKLDQENYTLKLFIHLREDWWLIVGQGKLTPFCKLSSAGCFLKLIFHYLSEDLTVYNL
jgi:hypothetical protein